ncbi:fucose-specific lectin [Xylaria sp. FL1042]|nr:fucose-specific lectin [Xylaria sp. FL1042]
MAQALDGSDVVSIPTAKNECRVYYQDTEGVIREHIHRLEGWTTTDMPTFKAKPASPLAVVGWNSGAQIRVYCVSVEGYLEEWCYSPNQSRWLPGYLNQAKFPVAEASKLAAVCWYDNGPSIRVYAQDSENRIVEYINTDPSWTKRVAVPAAQVGASMAAVCWEENGIRLRLYYQALNKTIKEHCSDAGGDWFSGDFATPELPPYTSVAAIAWPGYGAPVHVFFQDPDANISEFKHVQTWGYASTVVGPLRPGRRISALQWESGAELRVYYQANDNKIREMACSNGSQWYTGEFVS